LKNLGDLDRQSGQHFDGALLVDGDEADLVLSQRALGGELLKGAEFVVLPAGIVVKLAKDMIVLGTIRCRSTEKIVLVKG
jgi:hypothetical protein